MVSVTQRILQVGTVRGQSDAQTRHKGLQSRINWLGEGQGSRKQMVVDVESDLAAPDELVKSPCGEDHSKSIAVQLSVVLLYMSQCLPR